MSLWGLTIDIATCTYVVLVVGLCVDYSAHVAHAIKTQNGKRKISKAIPDRTKRWICVFFA